MSRFLRGTILVTCLTLLGCIEEPVIEIPVSNEVANSSLCALSEVISTFDVVEDLVSRHEFFYEKDDLFIPSSVLIDFTDTSFSDGDGIEATLDFGALGNGPYGVLCKDHKYRAGKLYLTFNKPYQESDVQLKISFSSEAPFYSGDGEDMNAFEGEFSVTRASDTELHLESSNLSFNSDDEIYQIQSNMFISHKRDNGSGLVNDVLEFNGSMIISNDLEEVKLSTKEPLVKDYALDCAKHVLTGVMNIEQDITSSNMEMVVDFDPFADAACDNIYKLTVNGKSVIFEY